MLAFINSSRLKETFFELVRYDTGSSSDSLSSPSTQKQLILAQHLVQKLQNLGLVNVDLSSYGIVTGELPANSDGVDFNLGFIAHMDTSPDVATGPIFPQEHLYIGGDIVLKNNIKISTQDLKEYIGQTILTSDGTTLLGADDKAGIAEILEMLAILKDNPQIKHPTLKIAFTPDEEVGRGTEHFDIKAFDADIAYTVDGSAPTDVDTETFNAFNPQIIITGVPAHAGYAYQKMVSAIEIAHHFISLLPSDETPATTKEREGYFHIVNISGTPEKAILDMLVRDFNFSTAQKRIAFLQCLCDDLRRQYSQAKIEFKANEKYHNMKENLATFPELITLTKEAVSRTGLIPKETYIRGGTDGAELTRKGLLTPNLGAGGENFHSLNEFVSLEKMGQCTENLLHLIEVWNENAPLWHNKIKQISSRGQ